MRGGFGGQGVGFVAFAARIKEFGWGGEGAGALVTLVASGVLGAKGLAWRGERRGKDVRRSRIGDMFPLRNDPRGIWKRWNEQRVVMEGNAHTSARPRKTSDRSSPA